MKVDLLENERLAVECDSTVQGAELIIRNILGRKLFSEQINFQEKTYSLGQQPSGAYFVQVCREDQLFRKRIERH